MYQHKKVCIHNRSIKSNIAVVRSEVVAMIGLLLATAMPRRPTVVEFVACMREPQKNYDHVHLCFLIHKYACRAPVANNFLSSRLFMAKSKAELAPVSSSKTECFDTFDVP